MRTTERTSSTTTRRPPAALARVGLASLALVTIACAADGPLPAPPPDLAATDLAVPDLVAPDLAARDLAGADLQSDCPRLAACDCLARVDCLPITESCWCPFPLCGAGSCTCEGGRFWGCAARDAGCARVVDCKPPSKPVGPDARGCFACGG